MGQTIKRLARWQMGFRQKPQCSSRHNRSVPRRLFCLRTHPVPKSAHSDPSRRSSLPASPRWGIQPEKETAPKRHRCGRRRQGFLRAGGGGRSRRARPLGLISLSHATQRAVPARDAGRAHARMREISKLGIAEPSQPIPLSSLSSPLPVGHRKPPAASSCPYNPGSVSPR